MKRFYSLLSLLVVVFFGLQVFGQTPMLFRGTGGPGNSIPLGTGFSNWKGAYIYAPNEFTGILQGGTINRIYVRPSNGGSTTVTNLIIRLSQTSAGSTFTNTTYPTGTLVYQGNITLSHTANGWVAINLQTGFAYNPSQSLIVDISNQTIAGTGMVLNTTALAGKRLYAASQTATTGTIDTQWSDFGFDLLTAPNNIGITALLSPANSCGETSTPVTVRIQNFGNNAMTGFSINTNITGALNASFSRPSFSRSIPAGGSDTAVMGFINTSSTVGNVTFTSFTSLPSDTARWNDTNRTTINFLSTPGTAVFTQNPVTVCGSAPINISTTNVANTSTLWYNTPTGGGVIGMRDSLSTGLITTPVTTFYAAKARFTSPASFGFSQSNTYYGGSGFGYYVDITPGSSNLIIDTVSFFNTTGFTSSDIRVYYRIGTLSGNEGNPSAWILASDLRNYTLPGFGENKIPAGNFIVPAGQVCGVYLYIGAGTAYMHNPTSSITNGDITISNSNISSNGQMFGNLLGNFYQVDIRFYYRKACVSSRLPITINMNPRPTGADLLPGSIFQGASLAGTSLSPDVVGERDTIIYKLIAPTGYTNGNFGSTWTISALSFVTTGGAAPGTTDTLTTLPSASGDGTMRFVPSGLYADSTFRLRVTLQNIITGCDSMLERFIYVAPKPIANFASSLACDGQEVSFRDSSQVRSGMLTYSWNFGDSVTNATSIDQRPNYTYSGPGTYNVTLEVTTPYGYSNKITKQVTVYYRPDADFTFTNVCLGRTSQFTNRTTIQGTQFPMTYEWMLGNNTTSTQTNTSTQYSSFGTYMVTLKARTSTGCERSITKEVNVFPIPDADFTTGPPCSGLNTQFTNNTTIAYGVVGYEWEFGDGSDETKKDPRHNYNASGTYSVKLISTSQFGCVDSVRKNVVVSVKPNVNFTFANTCMGDSVRFNNTTTISGSTITGYLWTFGNGNQTNSSQSTLRHTYAAPGTYTVTLKATSADNCTDEKVTDISITHKPDVNFTTTGSACAGSSLQFNNQSTIGAGTMTYNWNFGSSSSPSENPSHTFVNAGSFPVVLTATSGAGCTASTTRTIHINSLPNTNFTVVYTNQNSTREIKCVPADSNLSSYLWEMGDGTTFNQISPVYIYTSNGPFLINLTTQSAAGCAAKSNNQNVFFTVSDEQILNSKLNQKAMDVYPNPFSHETQVKIRLASATHMDLYILDQFGRRVTTLANTQFDQGEYVFEWHATENIASGIYYLVQATDETRNVQPIILKK